MFSFSSVLSTLFCLLLLHGDDSCNFLQNVGLSTQAEITCLTWNPKFQHILASANSNGITGKGQFDFLCSRCLLPVPGLFIGLTHYLSITLQLFGI